MYPVPLAVRGSSVSMLRPVTIASTRCEYASGAARRARTLAALRTS